MQIRIEFRECETGQDIDDIEQDIIECDGDVTDTEHNYDAETCMFIIDVDNEKEFMEKFEETDSYGIRN